MDVTPSVVNGLFALAGSLVGAAAPVALAWINGWREERRQLRDVAVQVAMASWKLRAENSRAVGPLEHQLVYSALVAELASSKGLTPEKIKQRLDEISAIVDVMHQHSMRM